MSDYNGWTNYATWRVRLEMFDGADHASDNDLDAYELGRMLCGMAEDVLFESAPRLAYDYAMAFLSDVNWCEIAEHMIEDYREEQPEGKQALAAIAKAKPNVKNPIDL
jgi:hypothetical protein